jgi:hypothetical protein
MADRGKEGGRRFPQRESPEIKRCKEFFKRKC